MHKQLCAVIRDLPNILTSDHNNPPGKQCHRQKKQPRSWHRDDLIITGTSQRHDQVEQISLWKQQQTRLTQKPNPCLLTCGDRKEARDHRSVHRAAGLRPIFSRYAGLRHFNMRTKFFALDKERPGAEQHQEGVCGIAKAPHPCQHIHSAASQ